MEWQQLEYFKAVARLEHITKAAEELAISQPALSRSIAKLEEELGVPLFERQGKHIILNRYGKVFLRYVERALQEVEKGQQVLWDLLDPDRGEVSLAFLHSLGTHLVPSLLGQFRADHPNIRFKLYQNATSLLLDQLAAGEIDICLSSPVMTREGIEWAPLFTEELFVIVPTEHRLANRTHIRLEEIATEPIISFKKYHGLRILTDKYFLEAGIAPEVTFEGEEVLTVAGLVEAKLGVAVVPHLLGLDKAAISFLKIVEPQCSRTIGMAWMKSRYMSPACKKFKEFVAEVFAVV